MSGPASPNPPISVVTGAFGYTGKYIARRLLGMGHGVRTLTGHVPPGDAFSSQIEVHPFNFGNPEALAESLRGAATLYNTYWVRFDRGATTFDRAAANCQALIQAARRAGVGKVVHLSVSNAALDSPLPYFKGKAVVEKYLVESGVPYAIIRPTLVFGEDDILLNNIAWCLRKFPVFPVAGRGDYMVQPVFVEDLAQMAVQAAQEPDNAVMDAAGPEVYAFDQMVRLLAQAVGSKAAVAHLPAGLVLACSRAMGVLVRDVVLTSDELAGLMANLLVSHSPPAGQTSFRGWLEQYGSRLGTRYVSELVRHYR